MSETPIDPASTESDPSIDPGIDLDPEGTPGADEGQKDDVDDVQLGAPATGPEAPVPPGGSRDADA